MEKLKAPAITLVKLVGESWSMKTSILSAPPFEKVGQPDLTIAVEGRLVGYIELNASGQGSTQNLSKVRSFSLSDSPRQPEKNAPPPKIDRSQGKSTQQSFAIDA